MERNVFDFHVHLYPNALAPKAVPYLAQRFGNAPAFDGTVAGMEEDLKTSGVSCSLNLPVATRPDQVRSINQWALASNKGPVYSLATIHPDTEDIPAVMREIKAAGFRGIKLHPEYQLFTLDDPRVQPIFRACDELDLLLFLHAGGERVFTPPYHTCPAAIAALLSRYPNLTVVAAHLGGFHMWDESEKELIGKKIYLDLSHCFDWVPTDEQIVRMVHNHGADRILFGTDAPWQTPRSVLKRFLEQPFTEEERDAILWNNARDLLRLPR